MKCPYCDIEINHVDCIGNAYFILTSKKRKSDNQLFPFFEFSDNDENSIHTFQCPECQEELTYSEAMKVIGIDISKGNF